MLDLERFTPTDQLLLKDDRIKFILSAHNHIEDGDEDGERAADHADHEKGLCLEFLLGIA